MNTIKVTTKRFAEMHKVDYALAAGFLRFMQAKGHVTVAGQQPNPTGKGKASTIYDVPVAITLDLSPLSIAA